MRVFWSISLLLLATVAIVADEGVELHVTAGFGGVFRAEAWTPVVVTVRSSGATVRGALSVRVESEARLGGETTGVVLKRLVEIAGGSTAMFRFALPIATSALPVTAELSIDGAPVATGSVSLSGRAAGGRLVVALSRRTSLDFLLPLYNTSEARGLTVSYPVLDTLPEEWYGYDGVDVVVLHDARIRDLSREQIAALRLWIAAGGTFVISVGAHSNATDLATAADLIGRNLLSLRALEVVTLGSVVPPASVFDIAEAERDAAIVVAVAPSARSTIESARFGRGRIVILPFDYSQMVRVAPVSSALLWSEIIGSATRIDAPTTLRRRVFETELLANQLGLPTFRFPSRHLVAGVAVAFVGTFACILLAVRRRLGPAGPHRLGALWIGCAVAVLIAAFATSALVRAARPTATVALTLELARARGGFAAVTIDTAIFSRPVDEYTVSYAGRPLVPALEGRRSVVTDGEGGRTERLPVGAWSFANAYAMDTVAFPVQVTVDDGSTGPSYRIHNASRSVLEAMVIVDEQGVTLVGDVAPGAVIEYASAAREEVDAGTDWRAFVPNSALAEHRARLLGDVVRLSRATAGAGVRPHRLLVAWPDAPLLPVTLDSRAQNVVALSLLLIDLDAERGDE